MIKQIIPVPDNLTAVVLIEQTDGTELWEDAAKHGTPGFMALNNRGEVLPHVLKKPGEDESRLPVQFRPAVRCPTCGQKMWIAPHADLSEPLMYECPGGDCMRRVQVE